jgi:hypothetical protein
MPDIEDKKQQIVDTGKMISDMKETDAFSYLIDKLNSAREQYKLEDAVDWADYKFRLGVLTGLSLFEEKSGAIIQSADRIARGKLIG